MNVHFIFTLIKNENKQRVHWAIYLSTHATSFLFQVNPMGMTNDPSCALSIAPCFKGRRNLEDKEKGKGKREKERGGVLHSNH